MRRQAELEGDPLSQRKLFEMVDSASELMYD
jgi:hypothetical protein